MQDVRQSFSVHQPMFNRCMEHFVGNIRQGIVDDFPGAPVIPHHFFDSRPIGWLIIGQIAFGRIDPEREQTIEGGVERREIQGVLRQQIPVECLQVSQVKNNAVPFRNGPFIYRIRMYDRKQAVSLAPRFFQFTGEGSEHVLKVYPINAAQIPRMERMNELRWHALLQEWVLVAAHRQGRPQMPANGCPFCPGSGRVPLGYDVHLYPNDFAAFRLDNSPFVPQADLFATTGARGVADVVLYHPSHNLAPAQLSAAHWRKVIDLWTARYRELAAHPDIQCVYIFENAGPAIGVTMAHPHGQIYGFPFVPPITCRELRSASDYYASDGECLYCRLLHEELADGRRIVKQNANFVAFVPFAARFPAEVQICARRHLCGLPDLRPDEADNLAELIKVVRMKYDNLFGFAMPLIMVLRHPPAKGEHPYSHFHIDFYPIQRSATKLKYLAGVETGAGVFLGDTVPEEKAREMRETEPL